MLDDGKLVKTPGDRQRNRDRERLERALQGSHLVKPIGFCPACSRETATLEGWIHDELLAHFPEIDSLVGGDTESAGRSRVLWSSSQWTLSWRKPDSNSRSHLNEKPFRGCYY
jgi:hypothetical protein